MSLKHLLSNIGKLFLDKRSLQVEGDELSKRLQDVMTIRQRRRSINRFNYEEPDMELQSTSKLFKHDFIQSEQVVFCTRSSLPEFRYECEDCVIAIAIDALAISKCWPDFAIVDSVVYERCEQLAHPKSLDACSVFGLRLYRKTYDRSFSPSQLENSLTFSFKKKEAK